ncbi:MAG: hypothetical protein CMO01_31535 [Thalassobius sp.]|nr:hypothetical protein [Thalassovita sp.]
MIEIISFEEYRRQQEIYSPIDTDEKLEFVKRNYKLMLLSKEDENFLEPISSFEALKNHFVEEEYFKIINCFFKLTEMSVNELRIVVLPSFKAEYQIAIINNVVKIDRFGKNVWTNLDNKLCLEKVHMESSSFALEQIDDFHLPNDIIKAITSSRKPKIELAVLDGAQYFFILTDVDRLKIAFKHSPSEKSKSGILIKRLEKMIRQVFG